MSLVTFMLHFAFGILHFALHSARCAHNARIFLRKTSLTSGKGVATRSFAGTTSFPLVRECHPDGRTSRASYSATVSHFPSLRRTQRRLSMAVVRLLERLSRTCSGLVAEVVRPQTELSRVPLQVREMRIGRSEGRLPDNRNAATEQRKSPCRSAWALFVSICHIAWATRLADRGRPRQRTPTR